MVAPAGTPAVIVNRLHGAIQKSLDNAEVRDRFAVLGAEPVGSTPENFSTFLRADIVKLRELIRTAGIKAS